MKKSVKIALIVIGIIWLIIDITFSVGVCDSKCHKMENGVVRTCSCAFQQDVVWIVPIGIPSWILFLIAAVSKKQKKR